MRARNGLIFPRLRPMGVLLAAAAALSLSCASTAPRDREAAAHVYTAPVVGYHGGEDYGTCTLTWWSDGPSTDPKWTRIRWSCSFRNTAQMSYGGKVQFELADRRGTDWVLGSATVKVEPGGTATIADTSGIVSDAVRYLGAPHWHMLCGGTDMGIRCGKVKAIG